MADTIDLTGSDYVANIPAVYYSTTGSIVEKFADKNMGQLIAKSTLPGGTTISTAVNLVKDPDNPGKVIASTVLASGVTYSVSAMAGSASIAITEVLLGSIAATFGIAASPVVISLAALGVVAVGTTYAGNALQEQIYNTMQEFEEFDIYAPEITGTVTQSEFILQSLENNPTFCMDAFPDYVNRYFICTIKHEFMPKISIGKNLKCFSEMFELFGKYHW